MHSDHLATPGRVEADGEAVGTVSTIAAVANPEAGATLGSVVGFLVARLFHIHSGTGGVVNDGVRPAVGIPVAALQGSLVDDQLALVDDVLGWPVAIS